MAQLGWPDHPSRGSAIQLQVEVGANAHELDKVKGDGFFVAYAGGSPRYTGLRAYVIRCSKRAILFDRLLVVGFIQPTAERRWPFFLLTTPYEAPRAPLRAQGALQCRSKMLL